MKELRDEGQLSISFPWVDQRLHGLSGVRNVRGGVWVVLKHE